MPKINRQQVETEKSIFVKAAGVCAEDGYNWVELEDKARQIISEYGAPFTSDPKLQKGLARLAHIKEKYLPLLYARNPREMLRVAEVHSVFFVAEAHLQPALFRKESRSPTVSILYKRQYPDQDDKNWLKHTVVRNTANGMIIDTKEVKRL